MQKTGAQMGEVEVLVTSDVSGSAMILYWWRFVSVKTKGEAPLLNVELLQSLCTVIDGGGSRMPLQTSHAQDRCSVGKRHKPLTT